jgi:hypothetical protein
MSITNNVDDVLHRIKVNLHPNYLPNTEGRYVARTENEASLNVNKICAAMKNRGGYSGSYDHLVESVRLFLDECAYQLCDGYSLNLKFFSVNPTISGTFDSEKENHNPEKNPVRFKFRTLRPLRKLKEHIAVDITGLANTKALINKFIDRESETVNGTFNDGDMFCITGTKIKIAGDDETCGVYFVPVDNPSGAVKVERLGENTSSMITGITPAVANGETRIEIRTQFSGSISKNLKKPRTISSNFTLNHL